MVYNDSKKTINWINALKALSIIAVFFVHTQLSYGMTLDLFNVFVYPWYVNAFFFISGYLLFWKQLSFPKIEEDRKTFFLIGGGKSLFMNILFRIVIPSILFSIIEFFPSCIIQGRNMSIGYALTKTIGGGTYWFTSALAVAELVLLVLLCTRIRIIWFYVVACFALGSISMLFVKLGIASVGIWAWRQGLIALVFLAMGGIYWRYEKRVDNYMNWWFSLLLTIVLVIIVCGLKGNNDPLISTLSIQPLGFLTSAISCLLLVWICKLLPGIRCLTFIGQNSIGFYFLSGALPISFCKIAHSLGGNNSIWFLLSIWIISIVISYLAVKVINHWLPWLWDLRQLRH